MTRCHAPLPTRSRRSGGPNALGLLLLGILALAWHTPAARAGDRAELRFEQLSRGAWNPPAPVSNAAFTPGPGAAAPLGDFSGTLVVQGAGMRTLPETLEARRVLGRDVARFPSLRLAFFSHAGHLVPVERDVIRAGTLEPDGSFWDAIVSPGRVWSEPGDRGWSRAAFPFALVSSFENETHNGIATFLFDQDQISGIRFQIVQQTAPYLVSDRFVAWGQLVAELDAAPIANRAALRAGYARELEERLPTRNWSDLAREVGGARLAGFDGKARAESTVTSALVYRGTLYQQPCSTHYGELPYCREARFGVWSITKSIGNALTLLRLAQKYGPEVFALRLVDYLNAKPPHRGWQDVTLGDALNMATGIGEGSTRTDPNDMSDGYLIDYERWYAAPSAAEKIRIALAGTNHPWGPGKVARYRDQDAFLLGAALDGLVKAKEGPSADAWRLLAREVFEPIGIRHAPVVRTLEPDGAAGIAYMAYGYLPSVEDLARIGILLQQGGAQGGVQILHAGKLAEALYRTPVRGLQDDVRDADAPHSYHMSFWHGPVSVSPSCTVEVPRMLGWGGNVVALLPAGMIGIRIANAGADDAGSSDVTGVAQVANRLQPLCGES